MKKHCDKCDDAIADAIERMGEHISMHGANYIYNMIMDKKMCLHKCHSKFELKVNWDAIDKLTEE